MTWYDLYPSIRRNSYTIMSVLLLVAMAYFVFREGATFTGMAFLFGLTGFLASVWYLMRPGRAQKEEADAVLRAVGNGFPTFINIYSDY